jgi:hypothetical protein
MRPEFSTDRFDVFHTNCQFNNDDHSGRDIYLAYERDEYMQAPVCTIVIFPNYTIRDSAVHRMDWIETHEEWRGCGAATEVLLALQKHIGPILSSGPTTPQGYCFLKSVRGQLVQLRVFTDSHVQKLLDRGQTREEIDAAAAAEVDKLDRCSSGIDDPEEF